MFTSSDIFTAHATIAAAYYELRQISEKINKPVTPFERAIDQAAGHDPTREAIKDSIELIKVVIENKKLIDADYSSDENTLKGLKELKKKFG